MDLEKRLTEFYKKPIEEIDRIEGEKEVDWGEPVGAEVMERRNLHETYAAIKELRSDLRFELQAYTTIAEADYRVVKALAACYELQDYLANAIAAEETEPDLEG